MLCFMLMKNCRPSFQKPQLDTWLGTHLHSVALSRGLMPKRHHE